MWRSKQAILMDSSPSVTPGQTNITPCVYASSLLLFHQQSSIFITRYEHEGSRITVTSNVCNYSRFFTDIQECYEVTLQLNEEQTVVKENSEQDAWEVIFFFAHYPTFAKCLHCLWRRVTPLPPGALWQPVWVVSLFDKDETGRLWL